VQGDREPHHHLLHAQLYHGVAVSPVPTRYLHTAVKSKPRVSRDQLYEAVRD